MKVFDSKNCVTGCLKFSLFFFLEADIIIEYRAVKHKESCVLVTVFERKKD